MGAAWWRRRRLGMFVHANLATVPAWAPIGQYAEWYRSHLGEPVADVLLHPHPLVEVVAHHRERWAHVERYDDFWPLLTFDRFDADEWAELATSFGAGYLVMVAKHHDGLCWWDAPGTDRTVLTEGPRRDVLAEVASACERHELELGTYYSLLDWADPRYPGESYVDEVLHPHVLDLVERYGSRILWGDGHWGHGPGHWRSDELIEAVRRIDPDVVVNDRWWASRSDHRCFEYESPTDVVDEPWELCRGVGRSFGHNRAERAEHHLDAAGIVALVTEVVAKGGNLLLDVGPAADGTIPDLQREPLIEAGRWVRAHTDLVDRGEPWRTWGDERTRYLTVDGRLHAVDLSGRGDLLALGTGAGRVVDVERSDDRAVAWHQDDAGLHVRPDRHDRTGLATVYRVTLEPPPPAPVQLFPDDVAPGAVDLAELVEGARPGSVVQLGDGVHHGPVVVPAGVTLRGLGPHRTTIDARGSVGTVVLAAGARLEHVAVRGGPPRIAWLPVPLVSVEGHHATVLGCEIDGHVVVHADDVRICATRAAGVEASGVDRLSVLRSHTRGMHWDVGIGICGGSGHEVDDNHASGHLCAVRLESTTASIVRGNHVQGRWWGVHLERCEDTAVVGNRVESTMRAVHVEAGQVADVSGNLVTDGDSGCLVDAGASSITVTGNRWERCRIGLFAWNAPQLRHGDNEAVDLHDPDHTVSIDDA